MKYAATKILLVFFAVLVVSSCSNKTYKPASIATNQTTLPNPSTEILINNGRYNRPYTILGSIEYTLKRYASIFVGQIELRNQAIALLKQEAFAKYGDQVDAIIEVKVEESTGEGYDAPLSVTHVWGIAVSFKPKTKHKAKSAKKRPHKAKSAKNTLRKTKPRSKPQEREITPSEILR